jgi:ribonuclease BN (tRNA processing enzyme)
LLTQLAFFGTGDYLAYERYWNGFVVDGRILVEPSPAVVPHLRRCGLNPVDIEAVFISHFHVDHFFGWPFLLLDFMLQRRSTPVYVVGPPGVEARLRELMELGGVPNVDEVAHQRLEINYLEVDGSWQDAGGVRFQAVEVEHVPWLRCFGYLFDLGGRMIGYSGDTRPCSGLDRLAQEADALVLECNGPHPPPQIHMGVDDVVTLRRRFPQLQLVLTHLGPGVEPAPMSSCVVAEDFQIIEI